MWSHVKNGPNVSEVSRPRFTNDKKGLTQRHFLSDSRLNLLDSHWCGRVMKKKMTAETVVKKVGGGVAGEVERSYASCSLHLEEGESWYPFNVSVRPSVRPSVTTERLSKKKKEPKKKVAGFPLGPRLL